MNFLKLLKKTVSAEESRLSTEVQQKTAHLAELQQQLALAQQQAAKVEQAEQIQQQFQQLHEIIERYKKSQQLLEEEKKRYVRENDLLKLKVENYEKSNALPQEVVDRINVLQKTAKQQEREKQALKNEYTELQQTSKSLNAAIKVLHGQRTVLQTNIDEIEQQNSQLLIHNLQLSEQNEQLLVENEQLSQQNSQLLKDMAQLEQVQSLQQALREAHEHNKAMHQQIIEMGKQKLEAQANYRQLLEESELYDQQQQLKYRKLEQQLKNTEAKIAQLERTKIEVIQQSMIVEQQQEPIAAPLQTANTVMPLADKPIIKKTKTKKSLITKDISRQMLVHDEIVYIPSDWQEGNINYNIGVLLQLSTEYSYDFLKNLKENVNGDLDDYRNGIHQNGPIIREEEALKDLFYDTPLEGEINVDSCFGLKLT